MRQHKTQNIENSKKKQKAALKVWGVGNYYLLSALLSPEDIKLY